MVTRCLCEIITTPSSRVVGGEKLGAARTDLRGIVLQTLFLVGVWQSGCPMQLRRKQQEPPPLSFLPPLLELRLSDILGTMLPQ